MAKVGAANLKFRVVGVPVNSNGRLTSCFPVLHDEKPLLTQLETYCCFMRQRPSIALASARLGSVSCRSSISGMVIKIKVNGLTHVSAGQPPFSCLCNNDARFRWFQCSVALPLGAVDGK